FMRIILDENIPSKIKDEIREIQNCKDILDVDDEYKGILDFELVDKMEENDIIVTRDRELHENLINIGKKSVYYDIEQNNLVEVQVKIAHYLKGYDIKTVTSSTDKNNHITEGENSILRERFDELKKENAELKSRVNVLEGKLKSVLNTARSALEDEDN
ncbi:MAG: hypothetical protein ACLFT7_08300, partial [Thermoplasmata archaeon]